MTGDTAPIEGMDTELARLRSENEALRRELSGQGQARETRTRSIASWVLAILAVIATSLALITSWSFRTLNETDLFVDRVGSIIEEPEVTEAIGAVAAAQLTEALELETRLKETLPDDISIVARPIAAAAEQFLADGLEAVVSTDAFLAAWDAALGAGHTVTLAVLSGSDSEAIEQVDGVVTLNLTPVVNALLAESTEFVSDLIGRQIDAPEVSEDDVAAAVEALERELGVDLPGDFGQVVLFESTNLASAQQAYQTARTLAWLAPVLAAALFLGAVFLARQRLRMALIILVAVALVMLAIAVALRPLQNSVVAAVSDPGLADAVDAAVTTVLSSLRSGIVLIALLGALAGIVLLLTGDSRVAERGRGLLGRAPDLAAEYRGQLLVGGAVVALVLTALVPGRSWGQVLLFGLAYLVFAAAVMLVPGAAVAAEADAESEPGPGSEAEPESQNSANTSPS